jgi:hypothetical protein
MLFMVLPSMYVVCCSLGAGNSGVMLLSQALLDRGKRSGGA